MGRERNWPPEEIEREVSALVRSGAVEPGPFCEDAHLAHAASRSGAPSSAVEEIVGGYDPGYVAQAFVMLENAAVKERNKAIRRNARA